MHGNLNVYPLAGVVYRQFQYIDEWYSNGIIMNYYKCGY